MNAQFKAVADHALLVSFATEISDDVHNIIVALDKAIVDAPPTGVIETIPALVNILVDFDPLMTDHITITSDIRNMLRHLKPDGYTGITHNIPVCYEHPFNPDLSAVAQQTGLSEDAVINAHLAGNYRALMYGFAPGFAYLAGVPETIQVPRKPAAIRDIPGCSVIIAGPQCIVTTIMMPTGWSVIGRSTTSVLTGNADRPFLFNIGDKVIFERITQAEFERLAKGNAND
ncbi:allophanate hydrolase subunit 1 [Roseovarius sp. EL26]|uniref:5-oxoprolinase subunit B family protein n=1 Tax=Roseovarius sp. EL26 TaxID=2126672 RepID=UPI000EA01316|nr:allophanate hydrolase subunit 1 [Roseovarius sp. EL26]